MRLSNLLSVLLGALAVGAVVAVLAVTGALPDKVERTDDRDDSRSPPPPTRRRARPPASPTSTRRSPAASSSSPPAAATASSRFNGEGGGRAASGSGFVVDTAGHIVTNDHVVENADRFTVRFGEKGDPIEAKLVGKDPSSDLAVLEIDPDKVEGGAKPLQAGVLELAAPR